MTPPSRRTTNLSDRTRHGGLLLLTLVIGVGAGMLLSPAAHPENPSTRSADSNTATAVPPPAASTDSGTNQSTPSTVVDRRSRTREGAVAAAAQYASLLAQVWPMATAQARAQLADAATAAYRARLVAAVSAQLVPMQDQATALGGRTTYRQSVLATHLDLYPATGDTSPKAAAMAQVSVWTVLTIAQTGTAPNADAANANGAFFTSQLDLRYERGAWRLAASTDHPGPTPLVDGTPSTGTQMTHQLNGFHDWRPR